MKNQYIRLSNMQSGVKGTPDVNCARQSHTKLMEVNYLGGVILVNKL